MSRLIDADEVMEALNIFNGGNPHFLNGIETAKEIITAAPTIKAEDGIWKPASVRPEKKGKYLVLWSLGEKDGLIYDIENYGTFEDWNDGLTEKLGWWEFDNEYGVSDCTEDVRYWTELPDKPEAEE